MALSTFLRVAESAPAERTLLRAVPEQDLFQHMMGKVKLSAPNLERVKQATRGKRSGGTSGAGADTV
jgi:hypothetical protein